MDLSDKNPFSLHALLGYIFPGAFTLYIGGKVLEKVSLHHRIPIDSFLLQFSDTSAIGDGINDACTITLLLIASFIMGHIVSYMSSITIEKITIWYYGYPSTYLLKDKATRYRNHLWDDAFPLFDTPLVDTRKNSHAIKHIGIVLFKIFIGIIVSPVIIFLNIFMRIEDKPGKVPLVSKCYSFIFRIGMLLLLLPWTICTIIFGWICNLDNYMARPLDRVLVSLINSRIRRLEQKLSLNHSETEKYDYLRVVQHYEYCKGRAGGIKMDNYVALYGFLRCMSFLFVILFWSCAYLYVFTDFRTQLGDWCLILTGCGLMSYVSYMGFMKFYRRYTVENLMSLVVDETLCEDTNPDQAAIGAEPRSSTPVTVEKGIRSYSMISILR